MDNHIRHLLVADECLAPAQAEVRITVVPEQLTPTTEVRGRFMGPRCHYAATIEVAYPLRSFSTAQKPAEPSGIAQRVIIPEASLWEPQCPFLYQGRIELWQEGRRCDQKIILHGLRSLRLTQRGLLVNGRPLTLDGRAVSLDSDEDALALRQAGCNLLVAPVEPGSLALWERADRLGFLVLGRVNEASLPHLEALKTHASCLGWLVEADAVAALSPLLGQSLVGLMCDAAPDEAALSSADFLCGPPTLAKLGKPLLLHEAAISTRSETFHCLGRIL